ncbi:YraN family protein [Halioxenophilus aromaticivorans]|uniref:UPF0102 protein GCM10025791_07840 n=1 Tax=Halioxenophilus aromaticivorans TaxID=1306992 RepID=A0AAV3TYN7_9ALTE
MSLIKRFGLRRKAPVDTEVDTIKTGAQAEEFACHYLIRHKHTIVDRNWRCRRGEIDIIAKAPDSLIFVEVKFRSRQDYGTASEMVSASKQAKLINAAQHYLAKHPRYLNQPCRFDLFALQYDTNQTLQINWLKNAFTTS